MIIRIPDDQRLVLIDAGDIPAFVIHITQALAVFIGDRRDLIRRMIPYFPVAIFQLFYRIARYADIFPGISNPVCFNYNSSYFSIDNKNILRIFQFLYKIKPSS